jgi:alpha-ribazole phosphatase
MIFLLRHGHIESPHGEKTFIGRTDLALSTQGREQAEAWVPRFRQLPVGRIVCSPLRRCLETAQILAKGRDVSPEVIPALAEIDLGEWEGRTMAGIRQTFPQAWQQRGHLMDTFRPPRGESFADVAGRVLPVFQKLMEDTVQHLLLVGHAGVNRVILSHLLGMPLANIFRLGQDYAALNLIDNRQTPARVVAVNLSPRGSIDPSIARP